jgi:hypothetical protein
VGDAELMAERDPQFPRTPANGCRACGLDFASLRAFDSHWRLWSDHRRSELLPFDEFDLIAAGFRKNKLGRWSLGRPMSGEARRLLDETVHAVEATP